MNVRWTINLYLPEKEKKHLIGVYDKLGIKKARRVLELLRKDAEQLTKNEP